MPARSNHFRDCFSIAGNYRFDSAITPVARPAIKIAPLRLICNERAKADALDTPVKIYAANNRGLHAKFGKLEP